MIFNRCNRKILLAVISLAMLHACSEKSPEQIRNEAIKILIYNDGKIIVNDQAVNDGDYKAAIHQHVQEKCEIWFWSENPFGKPEGAAYDVSLVIIELSPFHTVKLFPDTEFNDEYTLISEPLWKE